MKFCIKLAGVVVEIRCRYSYIWQMCEGYRVEEAPAFAVCASADEIETERASMPAASLGYCESLCIYRAICCRMPQYGAFLMHAAVVAVDGEAYIFAAPSGTGKTTHIRLWLDLFGDRAQVVNGDKPLIRVEKEGVYACGTPWQGKERLGCNIMLPVRGVCFLEQNPQNSIRRLTMSEAGRRIFQQVLIPKKEPCFDCLWSLLERMMTTVGFYLLQCNREPAAAQLSYETMRRRQDAENQKGLSAAQIGR